MSKQITNGYRTIVNEIGDQEVHELLILGSFGNDEEEGTKVVHSFMGKTNNLAAHIAELMVKNEDFKNVISKAVAAYMHVTLMEQFGEE